MLLLSLAEIQNASGLADILMEVLSALEPKTPEGLALNDRLQHVHCQHDDILKRNTGSATTAVAETRVVPIVNVNHDDDDSEDDFAQLAHRSSRDNAQRQVQRAQKGNTGSATTAVAETRVVPIVNVNHDDDDSEDDFAQLAHSGDTYKSDDFSEIKGPTLHSDPTDAYMNSLELASTLAPSSPSRSADTGSAPVFSEQPKLASLVKPADAEQLPPVQLDNPAGNYPPSSIPVGQTQNLSINSKIATQQDSA
ncbi:hypothetical protein GOBAR_AA21957 [Gossypium barbadense]|uniref:GAT domain-containing protein n=1 Tax=Gossypium barbadense TaxID=3634 RepID=A0A2P5X5V9_GOSBA|nr:hypothetical protein GOBAR_AA21957 [Gossypium barbadense]